MKPLSQVLRTDATLADWEARRSREQALTIVVRRHLPRALASRVHVADARSRELELTTDAGAIAGIVRQPVVNQPDRSSLRSMAALARTLPRGPLKTALERFLRRTG